ncbi:MAG: FkbM family methyltransferase [Bosea sp. (in: a-proteobacteria)]
MSQQATEAATGAKGLYQRLQSGSLVPADFISVEDVTFPGSEDYLQRIYSDKAEFDASLKSFSEAFSLFSHFPQGSTVLDVGAHWGYSAVAMRHQGCEANILSIEAMSFNIPALHRLKEIDKNRYDCINVAVGNSIGELKFYVPVVNGFACTGLSSTGATLDLYFAFLLEDLAKSYKAPDGLADRFQLLELVVPATTIDLAIASHGVAADSILAMKVDVEGHESPTLMGAHELLSKQKPLLMLENANRDPGVVKTMLGHGYFHTELQGGSLTPHVGFSFANDGFWIHPDRVAWYRERGLFSGTVPTKAEAAASVEQLWNAKDGFL